jgi:DNA/RNA-binding domain of Phe-tRNA-synthetase-like protein
MSGVVIDEALQSLVRLGTLWCRVARCVDHDEALDEPMSAAAHEAREATAADTAVARALYRAIRIDPTRTRPSSEALLRRVRKGDELPRVNTVVDIGNWCSLEFQLPYGVYDAARLTLPVTLRTGKPGEAYAGIRKDEIHLDGRFALFDTTGPFGNPSSDSARTMVTARVREVLVVVYAPSAVGQERMARILDTTSARLCQYAGGAETARWVS